MAHPCACLFAAKLAQHAQCVTVLCVDAATSFFVVAWPTTKDGRQLDVLAYNEYISRVDAADDSTWC
jgi:hypothetical protein